MQMNFGVETKPGMIIGQKGVPLMLLNMERKGKDALVETRLMNPIDEIWFSLGKKEGGGDYTGLITYQKKDREVRFYSIPMDLRAEKSYTAIYISSEKLKRVEV